MTHQISVPLPDAEGVLIVGSVVTADGRRGFAHVTVSRSVFEQMSTESVLASVDNALMALLNGELPKQHVVVEWSDGSRTIEYPDALTEIDPEGTIP